mgnify:CR=1 FL=1
MKITQDDIEAAYQLIKSEAASSCKHYGEVKVGMKIKVKTSDGKDVVVSVTYKVLP